MLQSRSCTYGLVATATCPAQGALSGRRTHRRVHTQASTCGHNSFHNPASTAVDFTGCASQGILPVVSPTPQILARGAAKHICRSVKTHRKNLQRQLTCITSDVNTQPAVDQLLEELRRVVEAQRTKEGAPRLPELSTPPPQPQALQVLSHTVERISLPPPPAEPRSYSLGGTVQVCQGKKCQMQGAQAVLEAALAITSASEGLEVVPCKCMGKCRQAVAMRVRSESTVGPHLHTGVTPEQMSDILDMHFLPALPTAHLEPSGISPAMV